MTYAIEIWDSGHWSTICGGLATEDVARVEIEHMKTDGRLDDIEVSIAQYPLGEGESATRRVML